MEKGECVTVKAEYITGWVWKEPGRKGAYMHMFKGDDGSEYDVETDGPMVTEEGVALVPCRGMKAALFGTVKWVNGPSDELCRLVRLTDCVCTLIDRGCTAEGEVPKLPVLSSKEREDAEKA